MSLTSLLRKDPEFRKIIMRVAPSQNDFRTISGNKPFEYKMGVTYGLTNNDDAGYVGTAFDYLARFRIAQIFKDKRAADGYLVAIEGFKKIEGKSIDKKTNLNFNHYKDMLKPVLDYIKGDSDKSIETLIPVALRLAYLEHIGRDGKYTKSNLNMDQKSIKKLFLDEPKVDKGKEVISNELKALLSIFEEKFLVPEIINKKSKVIYNPFFGESGSLVGGADGDIIIDGTLYDFKTSIKNEYNLEDSLQIIGYYLLNELSMKIDSVSFDLPYDDLKIKRLALYKARFGEIEYYDLNNISTFAKNDTIKKMAAYFLKKGVPLSWDMNEIKRCLKVIRDGKLNNGTIRSFH